MKETVRDDNWLLSRLDYLWSKHFSDVSQKNKVFIKFGRSAKYRFGSIRLDPSKKDSLILINGNFKEPSVPAEIVDHTIAHELVHYTHGFSFKLYKRVIPKGIVGIFSPITSFNCLIM